MSMVDLLAWATLSVTVVGVTVTLAGLWWQLRKQWFLNSANLITQLVDRFDSTEWHAHRRKCAEMLKRHQNGDDLDLSMPFPVLAFLENIAYLTRRGALDKLMVWNKFGWTVVGYYSALTSPKNAIELIRQKEDDRSIWEEFEWLYHESVKIFKLKGVKVDEPAQVKLRILQVINWEGCL